MTHYRIQTDEETGGEQIWSALHDYADAHPAPIALAPFVDRNTLGDFTGTVVPSKDGLAAIAWLTSAYKALAFDERTTPVLVTPEALNADTVTDEQIREYQGRCMQAGNRRQADVCRVALGITPVIAWSITPYGARGRIAAALNEQE